jgi:lambda family phage portal protein
MTQRAKPTPSLARIFGHLRADFRAGKDSRFVSRLRGVSPAGSGADYHLRSESQWLHMIERARHYQRDDQVVGQGVRRVVANIVQDGFRLDVNTGDAGIDADLKARWADWSSDADQCHSEGELTFAEIEALALSSVIVDGDMFLLPLRDGSLQAVEAHRCRTPRNTRQNVVHGVRLDDQARRTEYWFTREDLSPTQSLNRVADIKAYAARDTDGHRQVLHLYMPYRFSQRRGITALAPVCDTVGMHDDVQFATLVKSQMAALIALFHERDAQWSPLGNQQKGPQTEETAGGFTRTIEGIQAGLEVFGDPGEKLQGFSPNIPSPEFFSHSMLLLTFIAINLDIPVHVLLLDPSRTNFSGWRGAIDQARLRFKQIQAWLIARLHDPVYRWWLRRAIATDPALARAADRDTIAIGAHRWNPPTFPYIEPLTDASADLLQQRNGLNSPRRIQAARGRDWEEVAGEIIADNQLAIVRAIEAAEEINAAHPAASVHWRELISLPTPDGIQIALPAAGGRSQNSGRAPDKPADDGPPNSQAFGGRLGLRLNGVGQ